MKGFIVLDFGSQFSQMIVKRLRSLSVFAELLPFNTPLAEIIKKQPQGIILSGGPQSVFQEKSIRKDLKELSELAPVLGICYGMQLIAHMLGGKVTPAQAREYGATDIHWQQSLCESVPSTQKVWMSHGDVIETLPPDFKLLATSHNGHPACMKAERFLGFQFHPEVYHTEQGMDLLKYFVVKMCGSPQSWKTQNIVDELTQKIQNQLPEGEEVLCALSGGVDSTVAGVLLSRALDPHRVHCAFVDTGLLRKDEVQEVMGIYKSLGLNVHLLEASDQFLKALKNVSDPEKKRKIIGHTFIKVFKQFIKKKKQIKWLAQGTLYPDVIESFSATGQSATIKTHHNVGGLPKNLSLSLVEPFRELYKDEVRALGKNLGIDQKFLMRHPFPGPGLGIRILGTVDLERVRILQEADAIYVGELKRQGLYDKIWQAFAVLLPVNSVGVQGDGRTYENVVALRAVTSEDAMTADWYCFESEFLKFVSNRITNEVKGVNRVVYDITSKPPGTIEWE